MLRGLEPVSGPKPRAIELLQGAHKARPSWTHPVSVVLGIVCLLLSTGGLLAADPFGSCSGIFLLLVGSLLLWDGVKGLIERSRVN
jgi:hypothetical protein